MSYYSIHPTKTNLLYIHIPKTAGTSIEDWFLRVYTKDNIVINKHAGIRYKNFSSLDLFKFSTIRNPFSRAVSWYQEAYSLIILNESTTRFNIPSLTKENWDKGFDYFIQNFFDIERANPEKNDILIGFSYNQFDYISIDNKIAIDKIIRFENLDENFKEIENMIGTNLGLGKFKVGFNNSLRNYKTIYTPLSKKLIEEIYKKDLEEFGYEF